MLEWRRKKPISDGLMMFLIWTTSFLHCLIEQQCEWHLGVCMCKRWHTISIVIDNEISGWLSLKSSNSRAANNSNRKNNATNKSNQSRLLTQINGIYLCYMMFVIYKYKLFATYDAPFERTNEQKWWKKTHTYYYMQQLNAIINGIFV